MKAKFLSLFLLLPALAGCNTIQTLTTSVTPSQVIVAANTFDALEGTATEYLKLPTCVSGGAPVCKTTAAVAVIVPAIRSGRTARNTLEKAITTPTGVVSTSVFTVLTTTITTLQSAFATYNIGS
jgi:hypothetical protein